nr:hypothetical protein Iba_chr11eCG10650 [Ipomoea batatas]GME12290.1 hypothetical protein Iba_scaffold13527CG0020 [Ipomoea batatas]
MKWRLAPPDGGRQRQQWRCLKEEGSSDGFAREPSTPPSYHLAATPKLAVVNLKPAARSHHRLKQGKRRQKNEAPATLVS